MRSASPISKGSKMARHLSEIVFITAAALLVALVGLVNCLQGTPFVGALKCDYSTPSNDLAVRAIATVIFLLFLGLLLGPIAATLLHPSVKKQEDRTKLQIRDK